MDDVDEVDADNYSIGLLECRGYNIVVSALGRGQGGVDLDGIAFLFPRYRDDLSEYGLVLIRFQIDLLAYIVAVICLFNFANVQVGGRLGESGEREECC